MPFTYLTSPYSDPDPAIRLGRYHRAMHATAWMLRQRIWVYSPIVHCHAMAVEHEMPTDFDFWADYNKAMLGQANHLLILRIPGWLKSTGVRGESAFALGAGIPRGLLEPVAGDPASYKISSFGDFTGPKE